MLFQRTQRHTNQILVFAVVTLSLTASALADQAQQTQSAPTAASPNLNCDEPSSPAGGDDSSQKDYFASLLAKGDGASLGEYLKFWYPERSKPADHSYLDSCVPQPWSHLRYTGDGYITKECQPDVLYSWQPWKKFLPITTAFPDGALWEGDSNPGTNGPLWATISPVSTYSYGSTPVRIKFKSEVRFKNSFAKAPNEVGYPEGALQDFIIYNQDVVESYSYGTPELYDEIVRDILKIASGDRVVDYVGTLLPLDEYKGLDRVYHAGVSERTEQNEALLKSRLKGMIQMILNHQGKIHYAKDTCRNRRLHYSTLQPTYFNSLQAPSSQPSQQ